MNKQTMSIIAIIILTTMLAVFIYREPAQPYAIEQPPLEPTQIQEPPEILQPPEPPDIVAPPPQSPNIEAQQPDAAGQQLLHGPYLQNLLAGSGLTFVPAARNDLTYYELHTADKQLAGFIFPATGAGWAGPISLFLKTDAEGLIQRVHVWHHTETPIYVVGLDAFLATFTGHRAGDELTWQEDVHGITGATVTAQAIINAVYGSGQAAGQKGIFTRE